VLVNYNALRAYVGGAKSAQIYGAISFAAKANGTAGLFTLDPTDEASADDGATVIIDGLGRRWKRNYLGPIQVEWFGAVGDGITDNTAAIRAAVNVAQSVAGGSLSFGPGTFKITSDIPVATWTDGIISGVSRGLSTIRQYTDNTPFFRFTAEGQHGFIIRNLAMIYAVAQPATNTAACQIYFDEATATGAGVFNFCVEWCIFDNGYKAIGRNPAAQNDAWGVTFRDIQIGYGQTGGALALTSPIGSPNHCIERVYVRADVVPSTEFVFDISSCDSLQMDNIEVNKASLGAGLMRVSGGVSGRIGTFRLEVGTYTTNGQALFDWSDYSLEVSNLVVTNCTFSGAKSYIVKPDSQSWFDIRNLEVTGNTITAGNVLYMVGGGHRQGNKNRIRSLWANVINAGGSGSAYLTDLGSSDACRDLILQDWVSGGVDAATLMDADQTLTVGTADQTQVLDVTLTANRVLTLAGSVDGTDGNMFDGVGWTIMRKAAVPGAFTYTIRDSRTNLVYMFPANTNGSVTVVWCRALAAGPGWLVTSTSSLT
jgi:hypothetical protein